MQSLLLPGHYPNDPWMLPQEKEIVLVQMANDPKTATSPEARIKEKMVGWRWASSTKKLVHDQAFTGRTAAWTSRSTLPDN